MSSFAHALGSVGISISEISYLVLQTSIVFDSISFCLFITLAIPHHGRAASTPRNDSDKA